MRFQQRLQESYDWYQRQRAAPGYDVRQDDEKFRIEEFERVKANRGLPENVTRRPAIEAIEPFKPQIHVDGMSKVALYDGKEEITELTELVREMGNRLCVAKAATSIAITGEPVDATTVAMHFADGPTIAMTIEQRRVLVGERFAIEGANVHGLDVIELREADWAIHFVGCSATGRIRVRPQNKVYAIRVEKKS